MKYLNKLENCPIAISGTCLAFITLSNSWLLKGIDYLKPLSIALAICMLALMLLKAIMFPKKIISEMKNPVLGTFYPTIGMVTWLIAAYFRPIFPRFCTWLWLAAVVWHYALIVLYTYLRIKERNFKNIVPTCFIVYTGMITGVVASKGFVTMRPIADFMLYFGFIFYTALLPVVLYIVFRKDRMEYSKLPTIGIICSPAPLGVVGMLTVYSNPNKIMLYWLVITGLILLPIVYAYIIKLFKDGFKPMLAAFTFPLAIATLAAFKLSAYFERLNHASLAAIFQLLGDIEIFIATYVVLYVLINLILMFFRAIDVLPTPKKNCKETQKVRL